MCGIFGIGFLKNNTVQNKRTVEKLIRTLFLKTESRGRKASGIALSSPKNISVLKGPLAASRFIETPEFKNLLNDKLRISNSYHETERTLAIIGHCRLDTKGTPENNVNNHPIVVGNVVGVHNGVISNDDKIYYDNAGLIHFPKRNGEVDSEAIFALLEFYRGWKTNKVTMTDAIIKSSEELEGSLACAVIDAESPYSLWLFKQHGPISIVVLEKAGLFVFASEMYAIRNALDDIMLGTPAEINLPLYSVMCLNMHTNTYSIHDLKVNNRRAHYYA